MYVCGFMSAMESENNFGGSVLLFYYVGPGIECRLSAWPSTFTHEKNLMAQGLHFVIIENEILKTCKLISPNAKLVFLLSEAVTCWVLRVLTLGKILPQKIISIEIFPLSYILIIKLTLVDK